MKFSVDFIERVQEANNLVDIIGQYTQLRPTGTGLMGRCPFPDHPEKTPSFSVSEAKQVYHCFGCHKKGNIFTFIQTYLGMSFPQAIEYLANRAGISLPVEDKAQFNEQQLKQEKKKQLFAVNFAAAEFFRKQLLALPADHPVIEYMQKRQISSATSEALMIGYASEDWDALYHYLQSQGFSPSLMEEAKLVRARTQGKSGYYDLFRGRLMFPILALTGEVLGFGGRIILQGEPKYLNSPESFVFNKSKILYGMNLSARHIRAEDTAVVVEGYMDFLALYQADIPYVAATMGTALTEFHAKSLGRLTKNIVALFDGDEAGQEAAERSLPILLQAGLHPRGFILPDQQDPDDYIRQNGGKVLQQQIAQSEDLLRIVFAKWMKGFRGAAAEKIQIADKLKTIFACIQDKRLRQLYVQDCARVMGVEPRWLWGATHDVGGSASSDSKGSGTVTSSSAPLGTQGFSNSTSRNSMPLPADPTTDELLTLSTEAQVDAPAVTTLKKAPQVELILMGLVLKSRANFQFFLKEQIIQYFTDENVRKLLESAALVYGQSHGKFDKLVSLLTSFVDDPEFLIKFVFPNGVNAGDGDKDDFEREVRLIQDCVKRVKENALKKELEKLAQDVRKNPDPIKLMKLAELQKERLALQK